MANTTSSTNAKFWVRYWNDGEWQYHDLASQERLTAIGEAWEWLSANHAGAIERHEWQVETQI